MGETLLLPFTRTRAMHLYLEGGSMSVEEELAASRVPESSSLVSVAEQRRREPVSYTHLTLPTNREV